MLPSPTFDLFRTNPEISIQLDSEQEEVNIDFITIINHDEPYSKAMLDSPEKEIKILSEVASKLAGKTKTVFITNLPALNTPIHLLRSEHNFKLIQVDGIVTQRGIISSRPRIIYYHCPACGLDISVEQDEQWRITLDRCGCDNRKGFKIVTEKTIYDDYQWIELRELNENTPSGKSPDKIKVLLRNTLVDSCEVGEMITITSIRKTIQKAPNTLYLEEKNYLLCTGLTNKTINLMLNLTDEDIEKYRKWVKDEKWINRLIESTAPTLTGMDDIKLFLCLQQVGGVQKNIGGDYKRGSIHGLLGGDPGEGKSVCLEWAKRVSPRGIGVAGGGASGVGLTASVKHDKESGDWVLQGGAFVLADNGHVSVDEIEKMDDDDREHIHPAMERQIVPVNKAGINAELSTRCSVLGACNPKNGMWNQYLSIEENVSNLPPALLTRFDCIFTLINNRGEDEERKRVKYVLDIHKGVNDHEHIDETELTKFFTYARELQPKLTDEVSDKLEEIYIQLFKAGKTQEERTVMITLRQLEGLVRLSEASAKLHLREETILEDAKIAVRVLKASLLQSALNHDTGNIDITQYYREYGAKTQREMIQDAPRLLASILKSNVDTVKCDRREFVQRAVKVWNCQEGDVGRVLDVLLRDGTFYCPTPFTVTHSIPTVLNTSDDTEGSEEDG